MDRIFKNKKINILALITLFSLILFFIGYKGYLFLLNYSILFIFLSLISFYIIGLILYYSSSNENTTTKKIGNVIFVINLIISLLSFFIICFINFNYSIAYKNDEYYYSEGYIAYNSKKYSYESINDLKNKNDITIGVVKDEDSEYLGKSTLEKLSIEGTIVYYEDDFSLFKDLCNSSKLNIGVFSKYYKLSINSNEEYAYKKYLSDIVELQSFKDKVKHEKETLDKESFNILLIGYAPENEDESLGLADAIMIATVNLKSLKVNLTSISRSSDVKFACAGGIRDRINETINYGEKCLINTVENLMNVNIDYYVEFNFDAVVDIVDAVGGIVIDNPVEFDGQTSSYIRGEQTVHVPAGENVYVNGEQALAFARERNAYSDENDLQRQNNQQMVIARVVEKLLSSKSVVQIIKVANAVGSNVKTNININQALNIINKLLTVNNNTGISLVSRLSFTHWQLVGKYVDSYSYYLRNPMYIYSIYNQSIVDCENKINSVLSNYDSSDIKQPSFQHFDVEYCYYDDAQTSDYSIYPLDEQNIPDYYPLLIGETLEKVLTWANEHNVYIEVQYIDENDEGYNKDKTGEVIYQNVPYGSLVAENKECTIKVIKD